MTNKYKLTDEEVNDIYDYLFTQKEQFVHLAAPDKQPKLYYVEKELDANDSYIHALVLYRNNSVSYEEAYDSIDNYRIYDNEELRDDDFEQLAYEQAEFLVEDALTDRYNSRLKQYIDIDEVANDIEASRTYAEVLSSYGEEIEDTIDGTVYYLYKC